jgi:hypothetical protein
LQEEVSKDTPAKPRAVTLKRGELVIIQGVPVKLTSTSRNSAVLHIESDHTLHIFRKSGMVKPLEPR